MANIDDKVAQIRQAVYGKDVRESIASGIEAINSDVENAMPTMNQIKTDTQALKDATQALKDQTQAIKNQIPVENATAEIIDARGGFDTLRHKLDSYCINVKDFGAAGDGVTDDIDEINSAAATINNMGGGILHIPYSKNPYMTSKPILLYSNTILIIDPGVTIKLISNSNCRMVENANKSSSTNLTINNSNIVIIGGIWDGNGDNQSHYTSDNGPTTAFLFSGVRNLNLSPERILNTQTYAIWCCNVQNVRIHDIEIDQLAPAITSHNQDGIHFNGPASNITIENCIINSDDNCIALNTEDVDQGAYWTQGAITDVYINRIIMNNCRQGMLLLSGSYLLDKVVINNISGSSAYLIQLNPWGYGPGNYGSISISNINIDWTKAPGYNYRPFFIVMEGIIDTIKLKNINIPASSLDGFDKAIWVTKDSDVPATHIKNLFIDEFETHTITNMDGTQQFKSIMFYVDFGATINNIKLSKFKSIYNTSSNGILVVAIDKNSSVDNIDISDFNIVDAQQGILWVTDSLLQNAFLKDNKVDGNSQNIVYLYNSTLSNLVVKNSGNVIVPGASGLAKIQIYGYFMESAPTTGQWSKGNIIFNSNPIPENYIGWVCTASGVPGTWKGFGSIQP